MLKKNFWIFLIPSLFAIVLFSAFSGNMSRYPGGSPGGYTGSPGDGNDCTACHGGSASPVIGWITSNVPFGGYIPGDSYTITVTVSGNGDKGFEVSPQDLQGNLLGILTAGSGTKLVAGNSAVTQTNSSSSNPKVWNFTWKAPEAGTGEVTFYGAFTVNKPVTKTSTMTIQENTGVGISENAVMDLTLFPNPVKDVLTIDLHMAQPSEGNIKVTDITGSQVFSIEEAFRSGQNTIKIPLGDLSQGVYFVKVQAQDDFVTRKVLVW